MPHRGQIATDAEINGASREGLNGALHGAATWGIGALVLGVVLNQFSPIYRNLTFQFKVYLQMSGMIAGGSIEAEKRLRDYDKVVRRMRRVRKEQEMWRAYEAGFENRGERREGDGGERGKGEGTE